ncbi:hypothetical protein F2P81_006384 [Scophthalmus maximus]|uniref:Voltage-dependent calcium channel alpha-2/delta subunit conserved region domain-containing protein n=1 Tax=Scophthalmus maximus TaxID=52904 RepID=A0A6A4SZ01_SCOMX|nr:hypothetical protein F2P81_006384 [Scophthalmus maximus]
MSDPPKLKLYPGGLSVKNCLPRITCVFTKGNCRNTETLINNGLKKNWYLVIGTGIQKVLTVVYEVNYSSIHFTVWKNQKLDKPVLIGQLCSNIEGVCPLSCESADLNCFLVDNNGFILLSKERKEVGRFFGELDGSVMASLIKMGMYKKVSLFDYQAMCKNSHHHTSSARRLLSPFYAIAALMRWFVSNALMMFVVQQIPDSNLILIVTQADCDCSPKAFSRECSFYLDGSEHNATVKCNRMKSQKVRRRPESCHAYHPKAICSNFGSKKGKESFLNFNCRLSSVLCTEENRRVEKCDVSALSEPRMLNQTKHEVDTLDEAVNLLLVI